MPNLAEVAAPPPPAPVAAPAKGKAAPKKGEPVAPPPPTEKPSLTPLLWQTEMKSVSAVKGAVSSAHRALLQERDAAFLRYSSELSNTLDQVRDRYSTILREESSWNERWTRQVLMLKNGDL